MTAPLRTARRPDFAIVGAMKAGSSLLHNALREHPDVWLPPFEDPYFRDPVFRADDMPEFERRYAARDERRIGMKCPDYLARPEVPARLRTLLHDPDIIVTLRDPVGRALSAYFWWMRFGMVPVRPAEEGLRDALRLARQGSDDPVTQLLDWGLYGRHLSCYLEQFPREKVLVNTDDELRGDPAAVVRQIYEFLGVRPDVAAPSASTRDNPGIYSLERLRFLQRRSRFVLHWDETGTYPSIPKPRTPVPRAFSNAVAAVDRYLLSRVYDNDRPQLSPELTADLYAFYRDDVDRLESMLGRDLSTWRERAAASGG